MNTQPKPQTPVMPDAQTVTEVRHYTDRLFSFRVTRPQSLRFRSGEFVMIGLLKDDGKPLLRAYSIASPSWDDELEFYSIKVQDGPLTSRLQHLKVNDQIILRPKPVGTLVHDALLPGSRLWLFATGTGIAPFIGMHAGKTKLRELSLLWGKRNRKSFSYLRESNILGKTKSEVSYNFTESMSREEGGYSYVQDIVKERAQSYIEAMNQGSVIMVCGSLNMYKDILTVLQKTSMEMEQKPIQWYLDNKMILSDCY